jgi:hypothetical protein
MNDSQNSPKPLARRRFLIRSAVLASSAPLLAGMLRERAHAALPALPLDNAQAKALAYTEDASTVKHPLFKPGSDCANCQFFTAESGACAIFPGFSVAAAGWCSGWALKKG